MTDRQRHGLPGTVVRAIRRLLEKGETEQSIADKYGLTRETVSAIKTGRAYKHVNGDGNATDSGDGR
jgi:transcriptional regulator